MFIVKVFLIILSILFFSSVILNIVRPYNFYIRIHIIISFLPILASILLLVFLKNEVIYGPFVFNTLSCLLSVFIYILGFIIQKFSVRYLLGDENYKSYFFFFTNISIFASLAWFSKDLRIMVICWGITLLCLLLLIRRNTFWGVTGKVAKTTFYAFLGSWISFLLAILLIYIYTHNWTISLTDFESLPHIVKFLINVLLVITVAVPAGQFPFQKWLIETAVTPTPVSAIMHAGIVNAGGVILSRFSYIFTNDVSIAILLIMASLTVLIGSGISRVHVDYKRQLIGSTMSQMGFMLIQCCMGAYLSAIIHLMLHGIFKATLFLQSGFVLNNMSEPTLKNFKYSYRLIVIGKGVATIVALVFFINNHFNIYSIIVSVIIYSSISIAWRQLVAFGVGYLGKILGLLTIIITVLTYIFTHEMFIRILYAMHFPMNPPSLFNVILVAFIFMLGSLFNIWISLKPQSPLVCKIYLRLINIGEASERAIDKHPRYLNKY